ncbi:hypothetical protein IFM89_005755, partial [Coptis chinensis]
WNDITLRVPVPKVLVDVTSPVDFKAMEDHIEVKSEVFIFAGRSVLLLQNVLNEVNKNASQHRSFVELPSANWREVADNWFGACCCSFGGISEKLVKQYDNSYIFSKGTCLLDASSAVISNEDLAEHVFPDCVSQSEENGVLHDSFGENNLSKYVMTSNLSEHVTGSGSTGRENVFSEAQRESASASNKSIISSQMFNSMSSAEKKLSCLSIKKEMLTPNLDCEVVETENNIDTSSSLSPTISDLSGDVTPAHPATNWNHCCADTTENVFNHDNGGCSHDHVSMSSKDREVTECNNPLRNQKSLLNVSLGNGFILRNSNLSSEVHWIDLRCPQCSSVLGAYPSVDGVHAPADGGVRLFKCYTSTGLPVGGSDDIFRKHTLNRVFVNQLMETAHDELSFRTVVRDLRTRTLMLQIVLLNANAWSSTGYCLGLEDTVRPVTKMDLHPVVKVLFSDCSNATEAGSRMLEEWATKNEVDEVFMLQHQVKDLIESLKSAMSCLPVSCSSMQGLSLSSIQR